MHFEIRDNTVYLTGPLCGPNGTATKIRAQGFTVLQAREGSYVRYVKDDCFHYWIQGIQVVRFKANHLDVIDDQYAKDDQSVFFQGKSIPGSDPASFKVVGLQIADVPYFAFDKHQVYADGGSREGLQILKTVDIASLVFFPGCCRFTDRFHLFYFDTYFMTYANHQRVINNVDKHDPAFTHVHFNLRVDGELIDAGLSEAEKDAIIAREGNLVRYLRHHHPAADAWWNWTEDDYSNLKLLGHSFYADSRRVFFRFSSGDYFDYPFPFGYQDDPSYFSVIQDADPQSFIVLNEYYSRDQHHIYHLARPIEADLSSFSILDGHFAKDVAGVWYNGYLCDAPIDIDSFEILPVPRSDCRYSFAKDCRTVFATQFGARIGPYAGYSTLLVPLKHSDPQSFEIINPIWAKDKNNVYCHGKIWKEIDAASFVFLLQIDRNTSYAKDDKYLYDANGRRVKKGIDGASFTVLNQHWGKDKNGVFNFDTGRIIKGLDPASFRVTGEHGEAEDDHFVFRDGSKFAKSLV